jgi:hypothetical protein
MRMVWVRKRFVQRCSPPTPELPVIAARGQTLLQA